MVFATNNYTQHINSYLVQDEDDPYCSAVEAIDQELCSEVVRATSTHNYTQHINSYLVQDEDDLYCTTVEAIDEGLHAELVYNYV